MLTHEDLSKYWLLLDERQNVVAVNSEDVEKPCVVFARNSVSPKWRNLLRASGLMYNQLTMQYQSLQALIDISEDLNGVTPLSRCLNELQNAILLVQQAAREGVEPTAQMLEKLKH